MIDFLSRKPYFASSSNIGTKLQALENASEEEIEELKEKLLTYHGKSNSSQRLSRKLWEASPYEFQKSFLEKKLARSSQLEKLFFCFESQLNEFKERYQKSIIEEQCRLKVEVAQDHYCVLQLEISK